ncbi:type I-G CRISPR-associated protein Csb2 [Enhygromyxa salina]|uniref:CRISPR-associated protein, family n=1 Tax=Enhygromyxa salina TaxID=215803 RepID=A0A2S9YMF5_9BACT|nr:type I-U CRISPR-associated protein Csb2 [Enhygromyxa salina]PRQ06270.1 CRISPR-associated protein, family [Enhygromyxa salina]
MSKPSILSLRLELLTGRYVASEFNNRNRVEWPPHPARVFSALVAAHYEAGCPEHGASALRWLEQLPPPQLTFSEASERDVKITFVPVNDKAISDAKQVDNAWAAVFAASNDKQRAKAEKRLSVAFDKVAAPLESLGKNFHEVAAHVLPSSRTKQPRTFPTAIPEDPLVHLTWEATPPPEVQSGLDAIARALVRIGHSSSFVAARWVCEAPAPTWVPDKAGPETLRWVGPGQLAALDALHDAAPFSEQRVMPYSIARYRPARPLVAVASTCFSSRLIVLRKVEGPRLPITATEPVADGIRRALMSHASEPTPPLISGHAPSGGPLLSDHLAIAPLPYVGGAHSRGDLLGVALISPIALTNADLSPLYAAIARWEAASFPESEVPRSTLTLGTLGRWVLERSTDLQSLYNLRETTWTRASRVWASVTPVVLDRHPGSWTKKPELAHARACDVITAACRRIGLSAPTEIEVGFAPFFNGSVDARNYRRRTAAADRRPLFHTRLHFAEPVMGPILLGAGRYRGLGLLRPRNDRDD